VENKFLPTVLFGTPNDNACPPAKFTLLDESIPQVDDPIVAWNWQINNQNYNNPSPNVAATTSLWK
jgi:hypothetical protein